jgi:hypothetical protein
VTGYTYSNNFPVTSNALQSSLGGYANAFMTQLNASGGLAYSTYLGGSSGDFGTGIAVDSTGKAYVAGYTFSNNFPTRNALQAALRGETDAFIAKIDTAQSGAASLIYSTYLGGSKSEAYIKVSDQFTTVRVVSAAAVAVDGAGNAYLTGITNSTDFPTTANAFSRTAKQGISDAYVVKLYSSTSLTFIRM